MIDPIEKSVDDFLRPLVFEGRGPKLLLACSGGADSMVLAHITLKLGYNPAIAHCNFQLRGSSSDEDQKYMENWAREKKLDFFTDSFNTKAYAKEEGVSTQMAARDLRYGYFRELMAKNHFDYLLTAHHSDDSLETILINLGRGSGLRSLAGIAPFGANILRPLWQFSKEQLLVYAEENALEWREDASNAQDDYQRNFLRHHVVPAFKEAFPAFDSSFGKTLRHTCEDRQLFEELLAEKLRQTLITEEERERLPLKSISGLTAKGSFLNYWLRDKGKFDLDAVLHSLGGESGRKFDSETHELLLNRGELVLRRKQENADNKVVIEKTDEAVKQPISLDINKLKKEDFTLSKNPKEAALDYDKLSFPLTLRKGRPGDSLVPLGMQGTKKLSDFFIDQKIDRYEKENTYLLCSGGEIAWVVGYRIDDRFKVTDQTKTIYFVRLL